MHKDVSPSRSPVWNAWHFNLGDHWATMNYIVCRSYILREEMRLSRFQHGLDFGPRFREILGLLDTPERSCISIVSDKGQQDPCGYAIWDAPSCPTKIRWTPGRKKRRICFQFDGISSAESKNPTLADEQRILEELMVYANPVKIGKHQTLSQIVQEMTNSDLFIGCDSGMSHIAHSVGVPTIIVQYKLPVITAHRQKHYLCANGTDDLLLKIRAYLDDDR